LSIDSAVVIAIAGLLMGTDKDSADKAEADVERVEAEEDEARAKSGQLRETADVAAAEAFDTDGQHATPSASVSPVVA
jgi:hypothetical protein